jgi:hypothetical protein
MVEVRRSHPFDTLVGLAAACLLFIGTGVPAEAVSGNGSENAAVTADETAPSPLSLGNPTNGSWSMTDIGSSASDLPQSNASDADSSKSKDSTPQPQAGSPGVSESVHIAWGPLLGEAFLFASIENAQRICCEVDTKPELKGVLFSDYFKSLANIHGWDDWDPGRVQYIGHPFEGAVSERLEIQNDPLGKYRQIGTPGYWKSTLRAALFALAYGTAFKAGPYSEAMIGNVGLPNEYRKRPLPKGADYGKMAWGEYFINPILGTVWVITEDLIDVHVIKKEEEAQVNLVLLRLSQTFLLPSRSFANILRFKKPWYGEGFRPPAYATTYDPVKPSSSPSSPYWDVGRLEVFTGFSYLHATVGTEGYSLSGGEGSANRNLSPWFGLELDFNVLHGSGPISVPSYVPRYTFFFGPHISFRKATSKVTPFAHWMLGGARGPTHTYASSCVEGSPCEVINSSDTFFAGDVGGGLDINASPRVLVRALQADYVYDNFRAGQGHAKLSTGIVFNLRRHKW